MISIFPMSLNNLNNNYTSADVPQEILAMVVKDDQIYIDVLNAGPMVGTSLDSQTAADTGLVKNHWMWRFLVSEASRNGQIRFGFNIRPASVASDAAQYVGSSRVGTGSDHAGSKFGSDNGVYSDVGSIVKPPDNVGEGQGGGVEGDVTKTGDSENKPITLSTHPPSDSFIQQPTEGAPVPGVLEIKVRPRIEPSWSTYFTRTFRLKPGTTFGQLLHAMRSRDMEPFKFRKIGSAYLGCRDGISQTAAAWLADDLMLAPECIEEPHTHIYSLLGWRYSQPSISENLSNSDEGTTEMVPASGRSVSDIDRAVWPAEFLHVEDDRLQYNQPPGTHA